jgi:hypothetical protein
MRSVKKEAPAVHIIPLTRQSSDLFAAFVSLMAYAKTDYASVLVLARSVLDFVANAHHATPPASN